ncbi:MAG: alpha-2-macroglobulin [Thalassobaculum sp.]|uniref:alpha-2-macroglobulin family protein n=1 Tax=Thalassobaculum sp. TaxID=2022740 RepID=UPI0032EEE922
MPAFRHTRTAAWASLTLAAMVTATGAAAADGMRFAKERYLLDGSTPTICLDYSAPVAFPAGSFPEDYVAVSPKAQTDVRVQDGALCLGGLDWGRRYEILVRAGVPAADGAKTATTDTVGVAIPDAPSSVGFAGGGYVLAQAGETALPVTTVNVDEVRLRVLRIVDRNLIDELAEGDFSRTMTGWWAEQIEQTDGELVWQGTVETPGPRNRRVRTGIPIDRIVDRSLPGVHVVTAVAADGPDEPWNALATQWLVVSNLGLTTFTGEAGLTAFVNGLDTARPVAGVETVLLARNNKILGKATTDAEGRVDFPGGLLRGRGGNEATALLAYGPNHDFTVLRLTGPAFDLSDRGVAGRTPPGPLDGFLWADRDIFRPGETVHLAALLRTAEARATAGMPLTLAVVRPDGQDFRRTVLAARDGGAYQSDVELPKSVPTGRWSARLYADPKAAPVAEFAFSVEDFVPERLDLELTADTAGIAADQTVEVGLNGRFLFGAPAAGLRVTSELVVTVDPEPFPDWAGYGFGLATEEWTAVRTELAEGRTDAEGKGSVAATLPALADTTLPLLARVRATLLEPGGRGVTRSLDLKVHRQPLAIGIKPGFADATVQEDSAAAFQVVALDPAGAAVASQGLSWELIREVWHYDWVQVNGNWEVESSFNNRRVDSGKLDSAAGPVAMSVPVEWGWYRLEVYDAATGVASSVRFQAGWRAGPSAGAAPDKVKVSLDRDSYRPGDAARVFVEPPYAGEALVTVLGDRVLQTRRVTIPAEGAEFTLTADDGWGAAGAYVAVTLLRPGSADPAKADAPPAPGRAIGLTWLTLDRGDRKLAVSILAPDETRPERRLAIPVAVSGLAVGEKAWLTLAAVDRGVLALTGYETPDPESHYFGKRRLPVDLRDLYGRLIDGAYDRIGELRAGGDAMADQNAGLGADAYETVALFSGLVEVGPGGRVEVPLDIPDFNGELRLMAVAFSDDKVGHAEAPLPVRPPVVAELSRPRFLAPGDSAELTLELHNLTGAAGDYRIAVTADGPVAIRDGGEQSVTLATGGKAERRVRIEATGSGVAEIALSLAGPGDLALSRRFALTVRPAQAVHTERRTVWLAPGSMLRLDPELASGFRPGTVRTGVTLGTAPTFDLPHLIDRLYRYPYGCLEQTVSTAMPLLYLDELAAYAGLDEDTAALRERAQKAVWRILNMQRSDGAFSLWDAYGAAEPWLSAYALDFLTRARAAGLTVPDGAYGQGLDWLEANVVEQAEWTDTSVARPYAFHVLAKAGRTGIAGAARYVADNRADRLPYGARGQLAAALGLLGETDRAGRLLADTEVPQRDWWRHDYGTRLRDAALRLTVMTESGSDDKAIGQLVDQVADMAGRRRWLSTQEMSWLVLAAKAMIERQHAVAAEIDGRLVGPQTRPISVFPTPDQLDRGYLISNRGADTLRVAISSTGIPTAAQPPEAEGFSVERAVYALDGKPVADGSGLVQGERYVVILAGTSDLGPEHQGLLVDLLPAGLEIENTRLRNGGDVGDFGWLPELTEARHVEMRDDRFIAAYDLSADRPGFTAAYIVRAVTRGRFVAPAPYVEDMYQPHRFARGSLGMVTVVDAAATPK